MTGRRSAFASTLAATLSAAFLLPSASDAAGCAGNRADLVGTNGPDVLRARGGKLVVNGRGGDDTIIGGAGRNRICGGPGDDVMRSGRGRDILAGGGGRDLLDSGIGSDKLYAGAGADTVLGGPGGEIVRAGGGDDRVYGEQQDDSLLGGSGSDVIVGGHGIDLLHGGAGDDSIQGDQGRDTYRGGPGADWASFATATPPGSSSGPKGVAVNLANGVVQGDGATERISGIESVLGTAFTDFITGTAGSLAVEGISDRGGGIDQCVGFAVEDCAADPGAEEAFATVRSGGGIAGLMVLGSIAADDIRLSLGDAGIEVSGAGLAAGPGCAGSTGSVTCPVTPAQLSALTIWGDRGNDVLVGAAVPRTATALLDGGEDDDTLSGSAGNEILIEEDGRNTLLAGGGDDVLIGSSDGADVLRGGAGADQLASGSPCPGNVFDGGPGGPDIAGFGHERINVGIRAELGGLARYRDTPTRSCRGTRVLRSNEVLEGTGGDDILTGTGGPDALIIGGPGNDLLVGRGGRDVLDGQSGRDRLLGGTGPDVLRARDGERDLVLDCGPGGRRALRDGRDPAARGC